jgi:hypothetical protein
MNIKFEYLYRDAGNNKNWGEIIFTNKKNRNINVIDQAIRKILIEKEFFSVNNLNIPDLHFTEHDIDLDHDWHEYHSVSETTNEPTDKLNRDIADFIKSLNHY